MTSFGWWASLAPEGHAMCCLCFEAVPLDQLHVDDQGQRWDVCQPCHHLDTPPRPCNVSGMTSNETLPDTLTHEDCISGPETCRGNVEYRMALSATGTPYPRCDHHWEQRMELEQRLRQDYPDTDTPPAWFDPSAAGETWNDDY